MTSGMDSLAPVPLPDDIERRLTVYEAAGAALLIAVWGWFALVRNDQTPILVYLNIAVHESGHVLFRPFGDLTMLIMGSGFEVLFPFAVGVVFLIRKRDLVSTAVSWGWSASALASAATYIADADDGRLALLGASGPDTAGDWERILGERFFDKLYLADSIAAKVRTAGYVLWLVALGLAVWVIIRDRVRDGGAPAISWPGVTATPSSPRPRRWKTSRSGGRRRRIRPFRKWSTMLRRRTEGALHGWKQRLDRMAEAGASVLRLLDP